MIIYFEINYHNFKVKTKIKNILVVETKIVFEIYFRYKKSKEEINPIIHNYWNYVWLK